MLLLVQVLADFKYLNDSSSKEKNNSSLQLSTLGFPESDPRYTA